VKKRFSYSGKTGIARTEGFSHKLLADYSVNIGNICEFGCTFCYVPSVTGKQKTVQSILKQGFALGEFSSYRSKENVLSTVAEDLRKIKLGDRSTVFFCTTCDPCATQEHTEISIEAMRLILERSDLQIRVLSKSVLIKEIATELIDYKNRIIYSLSTGTALEEISRSIEHHASPVGDRVKTLHLLQDKHYRTYGMICPVLPSEIHNVAALLDQVRPHYCEHVWVEAINLRGKSLVNTYDQLMSSGLEEHASELKRVIGNRKNWLDYSKKLFLAFQQEMGTRGVSDKLRFLQYVSKDDKEFFQSKEGAICL
jgi:DNA repair photolyase